MPIPRCIRLRPARVGNAVLYRYVRVMLTSIRQWARAVKRDAVALSMAARDPRVPFNAKLVALAVAAYALSPIDLIPDFIPVLGYLDDLVIVPAGILLAVKLIPPELMAEFRNLASRSDGPPALGRWGAIVIVALWVIGIAIALRWLMAALAS